MATKKKAAKKKARSVTAIDRSVLKFNPRWFTDPGPDGFKGLNASKIGQINQLKTRFAKEFEAIVRG